MELMASGDSEWAIRQSRVKGYDLIWVWVWEAFLTVASGAMRSIAIGGRYVRNNSVDVPQEYEDDRKGSPEIRFSCATGTSSMRHCSRSQKSRPCIKEHEGPSQQLV